MKQRRHSPLSYLGESRKSQHSHFLLFFFFFKVTIQALYYTQVLTLVTLATSKFGVLVTSIAFTF